MRLPLPEASLRRSFVVVCFGFAADRIRRQPWHVAHGLATGLTALGHRVRLITDAGRPPLGQVYEIVRVPEITIDGRTGAALREATAEVAPERVFMIIGALALARSRPLMLGAPVSFVMASPRLTLPELLALGPRTLWRERELLRLPLANALLPGWLLRRGFVRSGASDMIYLSEATRRRYAALGLPLGRHLVPQIDTAAVIEPAPASGSPLIAYVGPPLDLRGARLAVEAFEQAIAMGLDARLLLLLRPDTDPHHQRLLLRRVGTSPQRARIAIETAMLDAATLRQRLAPVRLFLLPFRLTVSEAPLVTIEAGLSGRPVVAMDTPGVSEYVRALGGIVAPDAFMLPAAIIEGLARRPADVADRAAWTRWDQAVLPLVETPPYPFGHWRLVALIGVDGSGKSFLLGRLAKKAEAARVPHHHVWSRFRNYLSKPLLALARLTGHNRKEQVGETRIGYHDFVGNRALT
jgi:glycosyltransferase involved in cell wall biosynthesis